ncbi:MAG TPA: hypothetical protein VFQ07_02340 [Candidatus Polarisedimenticolia bacterium]|nr:hypothetical protein [Candidatus Polarisedimenticolia bacterium]
MRTLTMIRVVAILVAVAVLAALACGGGRPAEPAAAAAPQSGSATGDSGQAAPAAAAVPAPNVTDLMPAFWSFWEQAEKKAPAEQVRLLKEVAIAPHQVFYEKVVGIPSDQRLEEILKTLTPSIPALRRIDGEYKEQLPQGFASFMAAFPDMDRGLPIYAGPSLFTSSGQSRDLDGRTIVFYGEDVVAVVLSDVTNHLPDIHHEMFHAYHWQRNPEIAAAGKQAFEKTRTTPMYYDLWSEGLALHAVRQLDPEAPLSLVLSSKTLPDEGPKVLKRVAGELRRRLDVTNLDEVGDYFFFTPKRKDLPSRIAYYVGLRLVEEVGKGRSMEDLVRLGGKDLRAAIDAGLANLEKP